MLGSLSLTARRPLLGTAATLAVVAAVSGGVVLGSAETSGPATTDVEATARYGPQRLTGAPGSGAPDSGAPGGGVPDSRAAASLRRVSVAATAHRRAVAAQRARAAGQALAAGQARAARQALAAGQALAARRALAARDALAAERRRDAARTSRDLQRARIAVTDPRGVARAMAARRGWGDSQFRCLDRLWTKESNWEHTADNATSSAYGIPQALPGRRMASAGPDWRTNPATQVTWGLTYIADRYGTPCAAWAHSVSTNWY